jgi:UDP-GlcNAc3NAcA epimerase
LELVPKSYILATLHRAENTDDPERLRAVFAGLYQVAENLPIVLPLHPRTRSALERRGWIGEAQRKLRVIEPVGYLDMALLEKESRQILTDSGGVQKEAFFYQIPCVTLREETEWVELVELGWNRLVPPLGPQNLADAVSDLLTRASFKQGQPYGDGNCAQKIVDHLMGERYESVAL